MMMMENGRRVASCHEAGIRGRSKPRSHHRDVPPRSLFVSTVLYSIIICFRRRVFFSVVDCEFALCVFSVIVLTPVQPSLIFSLHCLAYSTHSTENCTLFFISGLCHTKKVVARHHGEW